MNNIGTIIPLPKGEATVTKRLMTEWSGFKNPSSFYEAKLPNGEIISVHENTVNAVVAGTYTPEPEKVKGPRKVSTKKERATKHVTAFKRLRMSRGEIIKALAKKLRVSRATAQTYFYMVK
jgi:hypothetical protein